MYSLKVSEKTVGHFLDRPIILVNGIKIGKFKYKIGTIRKRNSNSNSNSLQNGMTKTLKTMFKS